nr:hypothetical protein [Marinobacter sp. X15-166B]
MKQLLHFRLETKGFFFVSTVMCHFLLTAMGAKDGYTGQYRPLGFMDKEMGAGTTFFQGAEAFYNRFMR